MRRIVFFLPEKLKESSGNKIMKIVPVVSSSSGMLCDDSDYEALSRLTWRALVLGKHTYARAACGRRTVLAHRRVMGLGAGDVHVIDHINGNGLDNRRENLRIVTTQQNVWNRTVTNAQSGAYGVRQVGPSSFVAKFTHDHKTLYLGVFETKEEAAFAVNRKLEQLRPGFGMRNEIDRVALRATLTQRLHAIEQLLAEVGDE